MSLLRLSPTATAHIPELPISMSKFRNNATHVVGPNSRVSAYLYVVINFSSAPAHRINSGSAARRSPCILEASCSACRNEGLRNAHELSSSISDSVRNLFLHRSLYYTFPFSFPFFFTVTESL